MAILSLIFSVLMLIILLIFFVSPFYEIYFKRYTIEELIGKDKKLKELFLAVIVEDKHEEFLKHKITKHSYLKLLKKHADIAKKILDNKETKYF